MMNFPEKSSFRAKELLPLKKDASWRRAADSTKYIAETGHPEGVRRLGRNGEVSGGWVRNGKKNQYEEVVRELEFVKREISRLKLNRATVMDEKTRTKVEIESSNLKTGSYSERADALRKEIEEVCKEQALVQLAQIEAMKECAEIEVQQAKEADRYSSMVSQNKKKIEDANEEIELSKEIKGRLALTLSDITVLKNELKLAKDMDKRTAVISDSVRDKEGEIKDATELLEPVKKELEEAKQELALVREEGFQFVSSMDIIRNELKHVTEERARLKKSEEESNMKAHNLNLKLERAKSKLEAATAAEEKAKGIVAHLSLTLEQLKTQAEAAKKENQLVNEEITAIRTEIERTDGDIESMEERLEAAMGELEAVRASEAAALENLETLIKNIVHKRASVYQNRTSIAILKYEYDYLSRRAAGAEEVADKKVAAAQAWVQALKASEREILMKTEMFQREAREMRVEEEQQVYRLERSLSVKRRVESELKNWRPTLEKNPEDNDMQLGLPRKSTKQPLKENGGSSHAGRSRRMAASPGNRYLPRSTSISLKKRKKVILNLSKLLKREARSKPNE